MNKYTHRLMIPMVVLTYCQVGCQENKSDSSELVTHGKYAQSCIDTLSSDTSEHRSFCVTAGKVKVVPTWANHEHAYELSAKRTLLSTEWLHTFSVFQLGFTAKREGDATLKIHFEYFDKHYFAENIPSDLTEFDDDSVDPVIRKTIKVDVGENDWEQFDFFPKPPFWADEAKFHIEKQGTGTITLSHVVLDPSIKKELSMPNYKNMDSPCDNDKTCGDGYCAEVRSLDSKEDKQKVCSVCRTDKGCEEPLICGSTNLERGCVLPGVKPLGDVCAVDDECTDGICCEGQCSLCCDDDDCEGEDECLQLSDWEPHQCNPGEGNYAVDEDCFQNADCQTGLCESITKDMTHLDLDRIYAYSCPEEDTEQECLITGIPYGRCAEQEDL